MAYGKGLYDAALFGFVGHLSDRPVTDGTSALFGVFTDDRHDLAPLLGGDGRRFAGSRGIGKPEAHLVFCQSGLGALPPTLFPATDAVFTDVQLSGNLACGVSEVCHKDNPGACNEDLFFVSGVYQILEGLVVYWGDMNGNGLRS